MAAMTRLPKIMATRVLSTPMRGAAMVVDQLGIRDVTVESVSPETLASWQALAGENNRTIHID